MTPSFPLHIQGMVLRILTISLLAFFYGAITLSGGTFQSTLNRQVREYVSPTTPHPFWLIARRFGLPCAAFTRRYSRHPYWFLFLRVLRCFNSPRDPSFRNAKRRDFPFRDLGIKGCLRLLRAYPSLPGPSSVLEPNHPPSRVLDPSFCRWQTYGGSFDVSINHERLSLHPSITEELHDFGSKGVRLYHLESTDSSILIAKNR